MELQNTLQDAAHHAWVKKNRMGTVVGATGFGKTRVGLRAIMEGEGSRYAVIVPTEEMRDVTWPNEMKKVYGEEGMKIWKEKVTIVCYNSLLTLTGDWDLVIFDEIHHLTPRGYLFLTKCFVRTILGLTATYPDPITDKDKHYLLLSVAPPVFTYQLEEGVDDKIIADFDIRVIKLKLEDKQRNILITAKGKTFKVTEAANYEFLNNRFLKTQIELSNLKKADPRASLSFDLFPVATQESLVEKWTKQMKAAENAFFRAVTERTKFMYTLPSKVKAAEQLIKAVKGNKRMLVFCGSIEQAEKLMGEQVYHSKTSDKKLRAFMNKEIDVLGVIDAVNEGVNLSVDEVLIVQAKSKERIMVQRIGRAVRRREGHRAVIWVLCIQDTIDQTWVEESLKNFDPLRISYYSL